MQTGEANSAVWHWFCE